MLLSLLSFLLVSYSKILYLFRKDHFVILVLLVLVNDHMAQSNFIILNDVLIYVATGIKINVRLTLILCFSSISVLILDYDVGSNITFNGSSIESFDSYRPMFGVSVAIIKVERARRQEENPWIKPPNRSIDEVEYNPMMSLYQSTRAKIGIHVTRVSLKRPLLRHNSSISDCCPSETVSTIHLDDQDEVKLRANSLTMNRKNTTLWSKQSIPLDEIELSRLFKKSKFSSNQNRISLPSKRKKSRRKATSN